MFRRDLTLAPDGRGFYARAALEPFEAIESEPAHPAGIDFERAKLLLRRNRWLIAACIGTSLLAAALLTFVSTRIYRGTASVQLEQQSTRVMKDDQLQPEISVVDSERFLQTQVDILNSRALAIRVAERLGLFHSPDFLQAMGVEIKPGGSPAEQARMLRERTIAALQGNLSIALPRNSRLAAISFSSRDRELAARVANAYAEALIADNLERRYKASSYARDFLESQLERARSRLETSERGAIAYARAAGLIDTGPAPGSPGERGRSLITSSLISINDQATNLKADRIRMQQRWERAQATPLMNLPEVLGNPAIQELARTRADLAAAYQRELETHLPDYPSVKQAKAQLDAVEGQVQALATSIRDSIREGYEISQRQERAIQGDLASLRAGTLAEQQRSIQYGILRREVDTNRELYDGLLQRYKEVGAAAGVTANNITIVDVAEAPLRPSWPKPMLNAALALLLGMLAAAGLIFLREALDDAIRNPDDLETKLGVSLLATVPRVSTGAMTPLETLQIQRSALSEAYSSLRTALEFTGDGGVPRRLLVTSSQAAEGKSLTSYAIARSLALIGKRVLLVDGDLRRPSLAALLGVEQEAGFSNLLNGTARLLDTAVALPTPNLFFLPSGPVPPNPADLYGRPQARSAVEALSESFDVVIIDGPPVLGLADAPLLAAAVEGVVFLVDTSQSHRGRVKTAIRRLQRARCKLLGVVLTMFDARAAGYGDYGYSFEYGGRRRARDRAPEPALSTERF